MGQARCEYSFQLNSLKNQMTDASEMVSKARESQTLICEQITWGSCSSADFVGGSEAGDFVFLRSSLTVSYAAGPHSTF